MLAKSHGRIVHNFTGPGRTKLFLSGDKMSNGTYEATIQYCLSKLLAEKSKILNNLSLLKSEMEFKDRAGGDEIDQSTSTMAENQLIHTNQRLRKQLYEIESALHRIAVGKFGICEETNEAIEKDRLLAIPWTRLSIEGAEIRDALTKKYAKNTL